MGSFLDTVKYFFAQQVGNTSRDHIHPGMILGSAFAEITQDVSTNDTNFQVLLSISYLKKSDDSKLRVSFASSSSNGTSNTLNKFQIFINGTAHRACACRGQGGLAQAASLFHIEPDSSNPVQLDAGAVLIQVKWAVTGGTASIRPVTQPTAESAELEVQELYLP